VCGKPGTSKGADKRGKEKANAKGASGGRCTQVTLSRPKHQDDVAEVVSKPTGVLQSLGMLETCTRLDVLVASASLASLTVCC
jgi:hypothetical protein